MILDTIGILLTAAIVWSLTGFHYLELQHLWQNSPLPLAVYGLWLGGVAGTTAAIVAIFVFDFRERWFWRCLIVASLAWLAFPPIHALLGLLAFFLLLRSRRAFPVNQSADASNF
ncbi:hypothetical protein [Terrimicrobium sacchariphilum]|uniref:hypothetical protein n=1 Tax=Terrimicrobium sacchariphilum TaxID=690879 RepID=UPI00129BBB72|nr:hypothetical protein [Terrimicrobium sacchariphilum]